MKLYAPRILYDRTVCRSSRFTQTWASTRDDSRALGSSGVRVTTPASRSAAFSMVAAVTVSMSCTPMNLRLARAGQPRGPPGASKG